MFGVTPLPPTTSARWSAATYTGLQPTIIDQRTLTFRGDHRFSDHDLVFGRYSRGTKTR